MLPEDREHRLQEGQDKCEQASQLASGQQFDEAIRAFNEAEENFQQVQDWHWLTFARHEKLQSLQHIEDYDNAWTLTDQLLQGYFETRNKQGLSQTAINRASICYERFENYRALENLRIAENLILKERINGSLAYIYSNMAMNFQDLEEYNTAIRYLRKSIALYSVTESSSEHLWCLHQLGDCFYKLYKLEEAEENFLLSYRGYLKIQDSETALQLMKKLHELFKNSFQPAKAAQAEQMIQEIAQ